MNATDTSAVPVPRVVRMVQQPAAPIIIAAICVGLDYVTGPFLQFPITFVIPVVIAAWFGHARLAYFLAVVQPLLRLAFAFIWNVPWNHVDSILNCVIRGSVLILIAYLSSRTARQTRELEKEVKLLEGLLPVCSYCKKIRDESNHWQQIESYIAGHSSATFTHGICPECAQQYFGSVLAKAQKI